MQPPDIAQMPEDLIRRPNLLMEMQAGEIACTEPGAVVVSMDRSVYLHLSAECVLNRTLPGEAALLPGGALITGGLIGTWRGKDLFGRLERVEDPTGQSMFRWLVLVKCIEPMKSYHVDISEAVRKGYRWTRIDEVRPDLTHALYYPVVNLTIYYPEPGDEN